uniref:Uncharacterized protein n=1 Tax=Oryza barthii TaxID=65489 RepID=A0A0D3GS56_9ORYZ
MLRVRPTPTGPRQHSSLPSRLIALAAAGPSSPPADFAAATVAAAAHFLLLLPSALCTRCATVAASCTENIAKPYLLPRSSSARPPPIALLAVKRRRDLLCDCALKPTVSPPQWPSPINRSLSLPHGRTEESFSPYRDHD